MAKFVFSHFDSQNANFSGFEVIGAGLPRTGTSSMRVALAQLLDGACYHMANVFRGSEVDWSHWENACQDRNCDKKILSKKDWTEFFEKRGFRAAVDYPASLFYIELMEAFPNAKIILTVRDNAEGWHNSVKESIFVASSHNHEFTISTFQRLLGMRRGAECAELVCRHPPPGFDKGVFGVAEAGEEESVEFYNKWIEEVKRTVPKDRLLIFNVKQGWKPLCKFLGVPIPSNPFPHENETKVFKKMIGRAKVMSVIVVWVLPAAAVASLAFAFRHSLANFWPF